jgi:hypothetical protein
METVVNFLLVSLIAIFITIVVLFCIVKFLLDETEDK